MIDAADAGAAHVAAALRGRPGARYILAAHDVTVGELLARIAERWDTPPPGRRLDPPEAVILAEAEEARCRAEGRGRPAITRHMVDLALHGLWLDPTLARDELGLDPRPLDETIDRACRWYHDNGYLRRRDR